MHEIKRIHKPNPALHKLSGELLPVPSPASLGVRIREGRAADIGFIDGLQKVHSKAVGWMPTGQLEGHIARGHVLVAEAIDDVRSAVGDGRGGQGNKPEEHAETLTSHIDHPTSHIPLGYCIGVDKYFKREDTGIIYQMNIDPGHQRGLIGATLLQAMFDRWPYGVRLCCCWCAQDLQANYFWEAMGFVPLAFRAGSRRNRSAGAGKSSGKTSGGGGRVHIFWQKVIRRVVTTDCADGADLRRGEGISRGWTRMNADSGSDQLIYNPAPSVESVVKTGSGAGHSSFGLPHSSFDRASVSPYWFPSQTGSGALREDRIVLPIPPGSHWSEAKPRIYPEVSGLIEAASQSRALEDKSRKAEERKNRKGKQAEAQAKEAARKEAAKALTETVTAGGLRFHLGKESGDRSQEAEGSQPQKLKAHGSPPKAKPSGGKPKNDPRLVAAARELRDRWLEHAAAHPGLIEQGNTAARRYDVGKVVEFPGSQPSAMDALGGPIEQLPLSVDPEDQKAA